MRSWKPWVALAAATLAIGCASPYAIYLHSGEVLDTRDEPEYDKDAGFYVFEDESGREIRVNKDDIERMEKR